MRRYPKAFVFVIALYALAEILSVNLEVKLDVNQMVRQVIEYVDKTDLEAASNDLDATQDGHTASDPKATEHRTTTKQDRISQNISPSPTRSMKNRERREQLLRYRKAFNPRRT